MNYQETIEFLYNSLPVFHRIGKAAYKADLDRTHEFDKHFQHPHQRFKTIHVAGTNGKGSVSHFIASVLQSAGYKTGLYTSPHLKDFRERIKINGEMISEQEVMDFVEENKNLITNLQPSFFEMTVALAFNYFAQQQVDVAIIEVGLGGRLDSTNIINPLVSVITNISFDHMDLLGDTLEKIAKEKAGIIKSCVPVVIGETQAETETVFIQTALQKNAPIYFADQNYSCTNSFLQTINNQLAQVFELNDKNDHRIFDNLKTELLGEYQRKNIQTVLQTIDVLHTHFTITEAHFLQGIEKVVTQTGLFGRWQILGVNPLIVCDTGHNEDGIRNVMNQIGHTQHEDLHIIFGVVKDKSLDKILPLLPKSSDKVRYYFTRASLERAMPETQLAAEAAKYDIFGQIINHPLEALQMAKKNAHANDLIYIGGSTFVVAEIL